MTKLEEMWEALAAYQPQADVAGYGLAWARMCSERTADAAAAARTADAAAAAAADAADAADADAAAADAATAKAAAAAAAAAKYFAQKAINRIKAITTIPSAAQRTWVDLTDEEIQNCYGGSVDDFARALLAKSKERNT